MVKWFNNEKGFGYIEYKDNGNMVVHYSTKQEEYIELELVKTESGYKMKKLSKCA